MTITLTPVQEAWLEAQVRSGAIPSIEDAVRVAVADMMAVDGGDLSWAKLLVDQARAGVSRGEVIEGDVFWSKLDHLIASLETK
jgi:Arc/MetJ-type ribon-helix-helix transcriptional regulator